MRRLPFEPPTDFYHDEMKPIDEQLVELLKKRKDLSGGNPGFPSPSLIQEWSRKYDFYSDYLHAVFSLVMDDERFRPIPEPKKFRKHVSVMKSVEWEDAIFSVTFIRQYENASELSLHVDYDATASSTEEDMHRHYALELSITPDYDCRNIGGSGSEGHMTNTYIISPPLPDDLSGLAFEFKGPRIPITAKSEMVEFVIRPEMN